MMRWRLDILYNPRNKETYYFNNKTATFNYLKSIPDFLYAEIFEFNGKIWSHKKLIWG